MHLSGSLVILASYTDIDGRDLTSTEEICLAVKEVKCLKTIMALYTFQYLLFFLRLLRSECCIGCVRFNHMVGLNSKPS